MRGGLVEVQGCWPESIGDNCVTALFEWPLALNASAIIVKCECASLAA